jgi:hypothetical protein
MQITISEHCAIFHQKESFLQASQTRPLYDTQKPLKRVKTSTRKNTCYFKQYGLVYEEQ